MVIVRTGKYTIRPETMLRPDELEKLKNYITSYLMKRDSSEVE